MFMNLITSLAALFLLSPTETPKVERSATVQVNEPGQWHPWATGARVASPETGTGPSAYWREIPAILQIGTLEYYCLASDPDKRKAEEYGKLDFTIATDGPLWLLTTTRFGGGGSEDGGWLPQVTTQAQLEADGWRMITEDIRSESGYAQFGANPHFQQWMLFERTCKAGERFSIRTEKYQSPIVLQMKGGHAPNLRQ